MVVFDSYYKFKRIPEKKTALELVQSTGDYELFNQFSRWYLLPANADYVKANPKRKAHFKLAVNGNYGHLSSIFLVTNNWGHGNVKTANEDLLIFFLTQDRQELEVFIAEGRYYESNLIMNMALNGELRDEVDLLRSESDQ